MSATHPVTDADLRAVLRWIAAAGEEGSWARINASGDCRIVWRGSPVAFADRLLHHFDISHQRLTFGDVATILVFLSRLFAAVDDLVIARFGDVRVAFATAIRDGLTTDLVEVWISAEPEIPEEPSP